MPTLRNWDLTQSYHGGWIAAVGRVSDHPSLRTDDRIHTSPVAEAELVDGVLLVITASDHLYTLLPEWSDPHYRESTAVCLEQLGLDAGFADVCVQARAQADQARLTENERETGPGELLLEVIGTSARRALFRTAEGKPVRLTPMFHASMTQDSVLFTDWEKRTVDFRYWPMHGKIVPYHISDGLHTIKIRNLGGGPVIFGREGKEVMCPAGEVTAIPAAEHDREGLFSPDAVNGKSIFRPSGGLAKEERKD